MAKGNNYRQALIDAAVRIVELEKGLRGTSLRAIAKEAGCSHPNAYHFVSGLEELFWLAVDASMDRLVAFCDARTARRGKTESEIEALIASQYEFAFGNEGLYRMIWFETPKGKAPEEVLSKILAGSRVFSAKVAQAMGEASETPRTVEIAQILHSFIHGQIAKFFSGRIPDPKRYTVSSQAQALRLYEVLCGMPEIESYAGWIPR